MINEHRTTQLKGPFKAKEELIKNIDIDFIHSNYSIIQIGIQADPGTKFYLNRDLYEVGNTGLYEQMNTKIKSLYFDKDMDEKTYIEFIMVSY